MSISCGPETSCSSAGCGFLQEAHQNHRGVTLRTHMKLRILAVEELAEMDQERFCAALLEVKDLRCGRTSSRC